MAPTKLHTLLARMPIGRALRAGFTVVIALLVVSAAVAAFFLHRATSQVAELAKTGVPAMQVAGDISGLMNKYRKEQWEYLALPLSDTETRTDTVDAMAEEDADMRALFADYRALSTSAETRAILDRFEGHWGKYIEATASEVALADAGDAAAARETFDAGPGDEEWDGLKDSLAALGEQHTAESNATSKSADRQAIIAFGALVALLAAAVSVALVVRRTLTRRITDGLEQLSSAARGIARGELDQRVHVEAEDEVAEVAAAFDDMVAYLTAKAEISQRMATGDLAVSAPAASAGDRLGVAFTEMIENLNDSVRQVHRSVADLDSASVELDGVSDEIRSAAAEVVGNAERQVDLISAAQQAARATSGYVDEGVDTVSDLTRVMRDLDDKAARIGGIVGAITRIAGQTNLLALNAAIEAARAGTQGAGFAVVAGEVRTLAEESGEAAQTIAALVAEIQQTSAEAVTVVDDQARGAFERIAGGTAELHSALDAVGSFAGANQSSTERMAAATSTAADQVRQLTATAAGLRQVAGRFTVRDS
ncbi:methyl-accepting chemotaxis protein [Actinoplanes aureus]|uniref:MCP four helix bundle domain-containing protein n=1 Tax=Actinoplanes aureus TaxID=2792083 RepID=A0A931FYG0_9ACTN|nr:methyl-accepting chemotaxis protein [Actinoplanes aureus]MBG0563727.1 MCP four helix bundle domain-containing protein [Actinoplanes aureus]